MASQLFLSPSAVSWAGPAVIRLSTRPTEILRVCNLGLFCWTRNTMLRVSDSPNVDNKLTRNVEKRLGRFEARAQESSVSSFGSSESIKSEEGKMGCPEENNGKIDPTWFWRLLVAPVLVAAAATVFSIWQTNGIKWCQQPGDIVVSKACAETGYHFGFKIFGADIQTGEGCPGWIYFWLLMAAGCGLFVSEEALNVWVGGTLARTLIFDGTWIGFFSSVFANAAYIFSTLAWVYWGVCISDMVPFYVGKFAAQTKTSDNLRKKVGVSEKKLKQLTEAVQRHGNLIGFVERFSLGVRNPTSFIAGAMGVSPQKFFAGVCLGALITLPLQMGVGFVFRDRPMAAMAGVATVVGAWTILPYTTAGLASIFFIVRSRLWKQLVSKSRVENTSEP